MYSYSQIVAKNVEKRTPILTIIYYVEGPKGPEHNF